MRTAWPRLTPLVLVAFSAFARPAAALDRSGRFDLVTYNVAGLPDGLSAVRPLRTLPVVGARLNQFDLALIQEDYAYPALLREKLRLPYRTPPFARGQTLHFGDGLSVFGRLPFRDVKRAAWSACHGVVDAYFDCLTPKGLAMVRVEVSPGLLIDVYDVHLDAGAEAGDVAARAEQLGQLFRTVEVWSGERPAIVAGDFNLTGSELDALRQRRSQAGFQDACQILGCGQPRRLDKVLFRSGSSLSLAATRYRVERAFKDAQGAPLSDHLPIVVTFGWQSR